MTNRTAKSSRRRAYTKQEREARAREDARLMDEARAHLADADLVAQRTMDALAGMSPRILRYSLPNQMLLMDQADERGITLRDVDTVRGWNTRGRQVRKGERGLRIVRPVGNETTDADPDAQQTGDKTGDQGGDGGGEQVTRTRFRFMSVFEVSQTFVVAQPEDGEISCACAAADGEPCRPGCGCPGCTGELEPVDESGEEPGDVAWNNLQEQITKTGYRFDYPAKPAALDGEKLRVDHSTRTVHVSLAADASDQQALAGLAVILADLLTRAAAQRRAERENRPALGAAPAD
jgi:hypothetical protein